MARGGPSTARLHLSPTGWLAGARRTWADLPIAKKGAAVLTLALVPLVAAVGLQMTYSASIRAIDERIPKERQHRLDQTQILKLLVDAETATRGYLLTEEPDFLAPYQRARAGLPDLVARMERHEQGLEGDGSFHDVSRLVERELLLLDRLVTGQAPQSAVREGRAVMDRIRSEMEERQIAEDRRLRALTARRAGLYRQQLLVIAAALMLSLVAATAAGRLLLRGIVQRIRLVRANAERLAEGERLLPTDESKDEIGELGTLLGRSATLLRSRESALVQAKEEAERANRTKNEFLSRMSHELRTPLNAILGFAQLARTEARGDVRNDLDQIHLAGRHLLDLINEVLDISRIEAGELSLSLEPVSVKEVVTEAIALVKGGAGARGIRIHLECDTTAKLYVDADRQRLKQVLVNLLSNGVKYNRDGGSVVVDCKLEEDSLKLSVADTGPGLPEGALDRLFTPFARLGAEATGIEGTGLGLALSKNLIEAMGGSLEVGDTGPDGTEFCVRLNRAEAPEPAAESDGDASVLATERVSSGSVVLQVEDNPSNIKLVSRIMQRRPGVELVVVELGEQVVELAAKLRPKLILLDLNLPDISGRDVLGRLRADLRTRDLYVVMLSADATPAQVQELLAAGAADYLTKPIDVGALLKVVDNALSAEVA